MRAFRSLESHTWHESWMESRSPKKNSRERERGEIKKPTPVSFIRFVDYTCSSLKLKTSLWVLQWGVIWTLLAITLSSPSLLSPVLLNLNSWIFSREMQTTSGRTGQPWLVCKMETQMTLLFSAREGRFSLWVFQFFLFWSWGLKLLKAWQVSWVLVFIFFNVLVGTVITHKVLSST